MCKNIVFAEADYEKEGKAYSIHMEALGEDDNNKAMSKYDILIKTYADTEYYRDNELIIKDEFEDRKKDLDKEINLQKYQEYIEDIDKIAYEINNLKSMWEDGDIEKYNDFKNWYKQYILLENTFKGKYSNYTKGQLNELESYSEMEMVFFGLNDFGRRIDDVERTQKTARDVRQEGYHSSAEGFKELSEKWGEFASEDISNALEHCNRAKKYIVLDPVDATLERLKDEPII